jgi:lipoprotein
MKKIVMILLMTISFVGCFNEHKESFNDVAVKLAKSKDIQNSLTVDATHYREIYIDRLNDVLKLYNLKAIEFKKYLDEKDVLDTIIQINSDNPKIEEFLSDYDKHGNNHILANDGNVEIVLTKDKYGDYYNYVDFKGYNGGEDELIDKINVPINRILSTDGIIYQPSLEKCKELADETHYYIWGHKFSKSHMMIIAIIIGIVIAICISI